MPFDAAPSWRLKRRETILAAAAALFAERAYADVQVDEVAKAAGVGKATLYRYFPSKEDLYLESLGRALDELDDRLDAPAPAEAAPRDRLCAMVSALIDTLGEQLPTLKLLGGDHSDLAEQGRRLLRRRTARIAAALRAVLEAGAAAGQFRAVDTELTPILIIGMVRGAIMMAGDRPRDRLERAILDLVLAGTGSTFTSSTLPTPTLTADAHRAGSST
ncbi:TetR/AcrR family transcriptional regulator [Azospirillum sp. sgz302134]